MTRNIFEPFFLETAAGRIFSLFRAPPGATRCALFVAPFAEEMNKSRRQYSETALALVDRGYATLIVDLAGTGDSSSEFSKASWAAWKENLQAVISWSVDMSVPVDSLVAARLGCLLAAETLGDANYPICKTVFWQPVATGKHFMAQFLRLRVAASMMEAGRKESVAELKQKLQSGETLEVAGYQLSPQLCADIESRELSQHVGQNLGELMIAEVGGHRGGVLSPAGKNILELADKVGIKVDGRRLKGEPFWLSTEIVVNTSLQQLTAEFIVSDRRL